MDQRFLKASLVRGGEAIVAVALVTGFFLVELFLLSRAFPLGTGLADFVRGPSGPAAASFGPSAGTGPGRTPAAEPRYVARLAELRRKVKGKSAREIAWSDARQGEMLEDRHAVQTFERSGAVIAVGARGQVLLGENSLIVIRARDERAATGSAGVSLLVTQGDLRSLFDAAGAGAPPLEVVSGDVASNVVAGQGPSDVRVKVNPDRSTTVTVYRGATDVSRESERVRLVANQTITAWPQRPLGRPTELPPAPSGVAPEIEASFVYRDVPPRVRFAWTTGGGADSFRFEVSRDPEFRELLVSERVRGGGFTHGNLSAGEYYWRVSAAAGWAESLPGPMRRFQVREDRVPPDLRVEFPAEPFVGPSVTLRGIAERGASVFVGDLRIPTDGEGRFEWKLDLKRGASVIVVEALDDAGNATYRSGVLSARY